MTDREPMLSESGLRALLREVPEPALGEEQRARLRARLGLEAANEPAGRGGGLEVVDIGVDDAHASRRRRRWRVPVAAAAAAMLLFGGLLVVALRGSDGASVRVVDEVAEQPTPEDGEVVEPPAADPAGIAFCRNHVAALRQAVATWDGVENWAFLTDRRLPEPDLVILAGDALAALQVLGADPSIDAALDELGGVRPDGRVGPEVAAPYAWSRAERLAHQQAVESAIDIIDERIAALGWTELDGCR